MESTRGSAALAAAASAALVATAWTGRHRRVDPCEERIFRVVNDAPDGLRVPVWLVMQTGSLGSVAVAAWATRAAPNLKWRRVLVAGTAAWFAGKLVKPLVGRGRPEDLLDDVNRRGGVQSGLGFPSGHAAVATTLAFVATPPGTRARALWLLTALGTGLARMYVGAHLPLDIVGGCAIGSIIGIVARQANGDTL